MGEQILTQNQSQTLTQTQSQSQSQPQPERSEPSSSTTTSTTSASAAAAASTSFIAAAAAVTITNTAPAKIPFRPRKLRKVSPEALQNSTPQRTSQALTLTLTRSLACDGEVESALRHLRAADPLLCPFIDVHPPPSFDTFHPPFLALTKSILYQQLAYKAGTSIYTRFVALCGGEAGVVPDAVLALTPPQLRQIGVSARKASYLHDLARKYKNGILSDSSIVNMDDKSLFTMLTMVNGIGSWSVHMFMIFSLHRPDVLPINDIGVRKGVQLLYGLEELPRPSKMDQLCEKWRPYRSVASWYMWRIVEAKGNPSSAAAVAAGAALPPPPTQQDEQHQQHHSQQPQLIDPINSILNLGYTDSHFIS